MIFVLQVVLDLLSLQLNIYKINDFDNFIICQTAEGPKRFALWELSQLKIVQTFTKGDQFQDEIFTIIDLNSNYSQKASYYSSYESTTTISGSVTYGVN